MAEPHSAVGTGQTAMATAVGIVASATVPLPCVDSLPLAEARVAEIDEPPIIIAEAHPTTAAEEAIASVTAVFVSSAPVEAAPDPGDTPPPALQPPTTPQLALTGKSSSAARAAQALVVTARRGDAPPSAERGDGGPPLTVEGALAAADAEGLVLELSANAAGYRGVKVHPP